MQVEAKEVIINSLLTNFEQVFKECPTCQSPEDYQKHLLLNLQKLTGPTQHALEPMPISGTSNEFKQLALDYHSSGPKPGKYQIQATKPMNSKFELSLAYSPGVAEPCLKIASDPSLAFKYTNKGNLVAVITNGTAVLGLGDIGALAAKPVMEGKACLFGKFGKVDSIDICVDEKDPEMFVEVVSRLAPSFGGINLEDIKGPECFQIEEELKKRLDIPVFHDD